MKKLSFLILVSVFALVGYLKTQAQVVDFGNTETTVTEEQIKAWGEANQQDGSRSVTVLNFEGLGSRDYILDFYNGGTSSLGFSGTDYGIYFNADARSSIDADAGGSGNFANEPSPSTVMFFLTGSSAIMNVTAGFTTGFSFYYSSVEEITIFVYDGLDGTGNLLASQIFPANHNISCTGDPNGQFCNWDPVGVPFAGTAKSVTFAGVTNACAFDDVTFGSVEPGAVPVSNWALFIGIGLILVLAVVRFRRLV